MSDIRRRRRKKRLPQEPVETRIEKLSAEGRGIAYVNDQTVFIDQALENERVCFRYTRLTKKIAEGCAVEVLDASADRAEPECEVYGVCGGCSLQHMTHDAQLEHKQQTLLNHLEHTAKVKPDVVLDPVTGPVLGYRHKARLGVRYVAKKNKVLVGFRERGSSFITDTLRCEVLHQSVGSILSELSECISSLEIKRQLPQIEVAVGDALTVLVFRHLLPLPPQDRETLSQFCQQHGMTGYLQAGSPDELEPLWPQKPEVLYYELPEFNLRIEFQPSDFTQVNPDINRKMVSQAIHFLKLKPEDRVLDLFCGLGNFSLPIASQCAHLLAVEGSQAMVKKARHNANKNNIDNVEFVMADLYSDDISAEPWLKKPYNKILLDPPRSGAVAILEYVARMAAEVIVYVSCDPATLARDANVLVNNLGYRLTHAGIMDMFPHTSHVESMAVFEKSA